LLAGFGVLVLAVVWVAASRVPDATIAEPEPQPLTAYLPASHTATTPTPPALQLPPPETLTQPILVYHHVRWPAPGKAPVPGMEVTPPVFAAQLDWLLANDWQVVSFSDYLDYLDGKRELTDRAVVLTFDDGNRNQYTEAWPRLKERGLAATFFIYPNAIGRRDDFMNWDHLQELAAAGQQFGAHSLTHPRLYRETDSAVIDREVNRSRAWLEEELGVTVEVFAYPFGVAGEQDRAAVQAAGYRAARIYPYGPTNTPADRFELKSVAAPASLASFIRLLENSRPE
jgi:peptidoglycan/xylan/chitin deacetylase (PgdA/CDA1 family)